MKRRQFLIGLIFLLILPYGCISRKQKIANLHSFAKVYGYVRWFYPGDEVTQIDWNKFTVFGIQKVQNSRNAEKLKEILLELFKPIAPSLSITEKSRNENFDICSITPSETSGLDHVSWEHYGVYLSEKSNIYKSIRINRDNLDDLYKDSVKSKNINYADLKYAIATKPGDYIKKDIGNGLTLIMPLSLYSIKKHTYPLADSSKLNLLKKRLNHLPDESLKSNKLNIRLANIIIAWNVLQHFFPYFDVIHADWEGELNRSLEKTYSVRSEADYYKVLMEMTSKLEDAHVNVSYPNIIGYGVKIKVDLFGNDLVVLASGSDQIKKGDVIKSIDGHSAFSEIREKEELFSASSNVKRYRAINAFGIKFDQNGARITLLREGKEITKKEKRFPITDQFFRSTNLNDIIDLGDSICYIKGRIQEINYLLTKLKDAKGVIIGSAGQLMELLPYMISKPAWSAHFLVPVAIYPDRVNTIWSENRWTMEPQTPSIKAKFVVLTSPSDQSTWETLLGIVNYYKLATFVGDTTAGCNGNINIIDLLDNYSISWTGMKVLKQDSSQHHLIGFNPDYPVVRTKEAVLQGRDEYLEKAIEILKEK
jgi:hypothetical protein